MTLLQIRLTYDAEQPRRPPISSHVKLSTYLHVISCCSAGLRPANAFASSSFSSLLIASALGEVAESGPGSSKPPTTRPPPALGRPLVSDQLIERIDKDPSEPGLSVHVRRAGDFPFANLFHGRNNRPLHQVRGPFAPREPVSLDPPGDEQKVCRNDSRARSSDSRSSSAIDSDGFKNGHPKKTDRFGSGFTPFGN